MSVRYRRGVVAVAAAMLLALLAVAPNPARAASLRTVTDPAGDTKDPDTKESVPDARADAIEASGEYRTDGIVLRLKVADPRDPRTDPNWDPFGSTATWGLDTNRDLQPDYQIEFGLDNGELYVDVFGTAADAICHGTPHYRDQAYEAVIDPNCVGSPEAFYFFGVMLYADRNVDPAAPHPADRVPDTAMEGPVEFPVDPGPAPDPGTGPAPEPGSGDGSGGNAAPAPARQGYWLVARDGGIFSFGDAKFYGSTGNLRLNQPIVGMAADPDGEGYWFVASDGGIFAYRAPFFGSTGAIKLNKPIVGMASTPSGRGYWLVASDGGIFAFGDAAFHGSTGALRLNQPIVGMASTPSGRGYWLVASDGGIFAFGDASFYGSTGAIKLNKPIVGMSSTPSGRGYWFVASDGGIFSYGDARYFGSGASIVNGAPVVGMAATRDGDGYRLVRADGSVNHYGRAMNKGSMAGQSLSQPVVGMAGVS